MPKINGVSEWVGVNIVNRLTGTARDAAERGDVVSVELGMDGASVHQITLSLDGARSLRAELSELIARLEQLEPDDQLELPLEPVAAAPACPFGLSFCDGSCLDGDAES